MNRIQALAKFPNLLRDPVTQPRTPMRETVFHPGGQRLPFAADHDRAQRQADDHAKKEKAAVAKAVEVLRVRQRPSRTRQKDAHRHQDGKSANVEYSLHRPDRHLGGNRQVLPPGDQIRANEFSGTSQQGQTGETDQGGGYQFQPRCLGTNRTQKDLPADRPENVGDINKTDGMNDMPRPDLFGLRPESGPVEASPVTELQVNQHSENDQDSAGI